MAGIFLIVEGDAEERFYKDTFASAFSNHYFIVVQMPNKRNLTSRTNKGGRVSYDSCVDNVRRFLRSSTHCSLVALVYDYYGLNATFSGHLTASDVTLDQKVKAIEGRLEREINDPRFRFILQVHEFESYLFSAPSLLAAHFGKPGSLSVLNDMLQYFGNDPESINNSPETAPSKRLSGLFPGFGKVADGISIAGKIGVPTMRKACKRFDAFCRLIESL